MQSYSQLAQDLHVLRHYRNKTHGYFVEVGASDGIALSNTYLLERNYSWTGLCVEPLPKQFAALKQNRPGSRCQNVALSGTTGQMTFTIADDDMTSGLTQFLRSTVTDTTTVQVQTQTLLDLLVEQNAPKHIDYLSLDTEGSEYDILKTFDFSRYTFGLIDVEHNYIEPRRQEIRRLLLANGYRYLGENKWDDMYAFIR